MIMSGQPRTGSITASTIVYLLRNIAAYQFHDTSYESNFKKKWDVSDNRQLRSDGGQLWRRCCTGWNRRT